MTHDVLLYISLVANIALLSLVTMLVITHHAERKDLLDRVMAKHLSEYTLAKNGKTRKSGTNNFIKAALIAAKRHDNDSDTV